jgi:hypothetical protein
MALIGWAAHEATTDQALFNLVGQEARLGISGCSSIIIIDQ